MEPNVKRTTESRVDLFDGDGHLIGTIRRPIADDVLGPGREKVYLARRASRPARDPQHSEAA